MDNPETLAILGARHTTQHRKLKRWATLGANRCAHDGHTIPASHKTPVVLLIYIVKFGKSLVGERGKK